ncbi:MAG: hypothetical protein LBT34_01975 [Clostridiales Family XIII bacterium]|nr:hypothetical protein [Clostridiales Family XIII bacterium]
MKKTAKLICVAVLAAEILSSGLCFADGLNLVENYPRAGSSSSAPVNLGIKLFFDGNVADPSVREINRQCFSLSGPGGQTVPLKVLYKESEPNYILVLTEPEDRLKGLESNEEYKLTVSEGLQAAGGATLGKAETIAFRTRNTDTDVTVNMVIMGVMFVGMFVFSSLSLKKRLKKEGEQESKVNPYKLAKESGKSVNEVVEKVEKVKKKGTKKQTEDGGHAAQGGNAPVEGRKYVKRVRAPRPVSSAGGTGVIEEKKTIVETERGTKSTARPKKAKRKNKKSKKKK